MQASKGEINKQVFYPEYLQGLHNPVSEQTIIQQLTENQEQWSLMNHEIAEQLQVRFNGVVNETYQELDPHSIRVKKMIEKLVNFQQINALNY
jgi:hypothetical protein